MTTTAKQPAIEAADKALRQTDHTRLPTWVVARIAVETATPLLELDYEKRMLNPLRRENERLKARVNRLERTITSKH